MWISSWIITWSICLHRCSQKVAMKLANLGAIVVIACRDVVKGEETIQEIKKQILKLKVVIYNLDFLGILNLI